MSEYPFLEQIEGPRDLKKFPVELLSEIAAEMRQAICNQVSRSGGHLAPNLGVVELTLALHYVFDFSLDRLLFDVGHQCYTHKLVTGRLPLLDRLRQRNGMAGHAVNGFGNRRHQGISGRGLQYRKPIAQAVDSGQYRGGSAH